MGKGVSRLVIATLVTALIAFCLIYFTRRTEGFADTNYAFVGIRLKTSLDNIKEAMNSFLSTFLVMPANSFTTANVKAYVEFSSKSSAISVEEFKKLRHSIIDVTTGAVVYDPFGDFISSKPISEFPSSSEIKSYIIYINIDNIQSAPCDDTKDCYFTPRSGIDAKYTNKCVSPSPRCVTNIVYRNGFNQNERDTIDTDIKSLLKTTPFTMPNQNNISSTMNKLWNAQTGRTLISFLGLFPTSPIFEGAIYEPTVPYTIKAEEITDNPDVQTVAPTVTSTAGFTDFKEGFFSIDAYVAALVDKDGKKVISALVDKDGNKVISAPSSSSSSSGRLSTEVIIGIVIGGVVLLGGLVNIAMKKSRNSSGYPDQYSAQGGGRGWARRSGKN